MLSFYGEELINFLALLFRIAILIVAIVLLYKIAAEKEKIRAQEIDEKRIKTIRNLTIWSLVISPLSCLGLTYLIFPILALVFANNHARKALLAQDVTSAIRKSDLALTFITISNSLIVFISTIMIMASICKCVFYLGELTF